MTTAVDDVLAGRGRWAVAQGDCRALLRPLPAGCVHCCVTSPPYYGLRDYGVPGQLGLEKTPAEYVAAMVEVFEEVRRVLRDDGTLWLNVGDSYNADGRKGCSHMGIGKNNGYSAWVNKTAEGTKPKDLLGIPWQLAFALRDAGWYLRSEVIWAKVSPMPESVRDRPTKAHEQVFLLTKRPAYYYDQEAERVATSPTSHPWRPREKAECVGDKYAEMERHTGTRNGEHGVGRNLWSYWTDIRPEPFDAAHFACFPPDLPRRCIRLGTSEKGVCPACGAPWRRVVERERGDSEARQRPKRTAGMNSRTSTLSLSGNGSKEWAERGSKAIATGWQPGCSCDLADPIPAVVLDPFAGAGTALMVALRLGRRAIGCELNPEYVALAERRIKADAPLFNAV